MFKHDATWNSERVEALKRCFEAGFSCSVIAREIGVTRNAVIGKMNRLGLSRRNTVITRRERHPRPERLNFRPRRPTIFVQQEILKTAFPKPKPCDEIPIRDGRGCTLLELDEGKCRWPISPTGSADFSFCGNEQAKGLPYCQGHARLAYRPSGRERSA